jgi:hypothetical protein
VLFDGDTRLLFATSFDGPWDAYMEDFASKPLKLFDSIFRHVEGYEGLPDLAAVEAFILSARQTAAGYSRNYGGTIKEIRKSLRVNEARVASHLGAARGRRADRGHHRPLRLPEPRAAEPEDGGEQHCTCALPTGETATVQVETEHGGNGTRLFAGPRWDPFILDAPAMLKTIATEQLAFTDPGAIYLDGKNVLGLVVELDCASVLGDLALVGVAAETLTRGKLNVFHPAHVYEGAYRARLNANLAFWDGLDGNVDWPLDEHGAHPLTELMLAD